MSPFRHGTHYADALLPVSPYTETAGTFVNCEGRSQAFNGVVKPLGETRPAWKVLRVLGSLLGLPGFDFESIDDVRASLPATAEIVENLRNETRVAIVTPATRIVRNRACRGHSDPLRGPARAPGAGTAADRRCETTASAHERADACRGSVSRKARRSKSGKAAARPC